MYLSLYCKGSKRLFKVCVWEGSGDRTETAIFWPPLLWPSTLCLSRSLDAQPGALGSTLLGTGFLYCILSANSLVPKLYRVSRGPPPPDVAFPTTLVSLPLQLELELNSTELYNSATPTRSPTRSLEWHDWSSSSGNNCHAIHRSLSSGASVHECTIGFFYLVQFQQPISAHAISSHNWHYDMCHFFPVHHLGMAFLAGSKYNIRTCSYIFLYLFLCVYKYIFLWIFLDIFKYTYLYIYIKLVCVCMYICIYIYIYIYGCLCIYFLVYIYVCVCAFVK